MSKGHSKRTGHFEGREKKLFTVNIGMRWMDNSIEPYMNFLLSELTDFGKYWQISKDQHELESTPEK